MSNSNNNQTLVSIVITAHNYGKYLPKALDSALSQIYDSYEVIVVNDGSTDNTDEILKTYSTDERVSVIKTEGVGLAAASNLGIRQSKGQYVVRLDADDWFDENLLLVEANFLDKNPTIGMVFCDYYTVDVHGEIIQTIRRAKINDEVDLLDRPCLAAGAMYRRDCYDAIGGYSEELRYQEDYDFWIKFIEKYQVRNISVPLMYYRQHGGSMSRNFEARMKSRRKIKEKFVTENRNKIDKRILVVIPARSDKLDGHKLSLLPIGESTLLENCIKKIQQIDIVDRIIISTDDHEIMELASSLNAEVPYLRSKSSTSPSVPFENSLNELLQWLAENDNYSSDIIVICHPHTPLIKADHIVEAINTLLIYDTDSVIAVVEDLTYHWQAGQKGLVPVGYQERVVRQEKDLVFKEAGAFYAINTSQFTQSGDLLGKSVGHIELSPHQAIRIQNQFDYWLINKFIDSKEELNFI